MICQRPSKIVKKKMLATETKNATYVSWKQNSKQGRKTIITVWLLLPPSSPKSPAAMV